MRITVLAVGQKMPDWVGAATQAYAKRFGREIQYKLVEIRANKRTETSVAQAMAAEEARLVEAMPSGAWLVVLDEHGMDMNSVKLSGCLKDWLALGRPVCFVIGGADGLSDAFKARADMLMRLSSLTLPHGLVRVLLTEQLYRAASILNHHPYHRE